MTRTPVGSAPLLFIFFSPHVHLSLDIAIIYRGISRSQIAWAIGLHGRLSSFVSDAIYRLIIDWSCERAGRFYLRAKKTKKSTLSTIYVYVIRLSAHLATPLYHMRGHRISATKNRPIKDAQYARDINKPMVQNG